MALYDGTQVATTVAAGLNAGVARPCAEVLVQADSNNAQDVYIGNATTQSVRLQPGASERFRVLDVSQLFVKTSSATATVNWHAWD